MKSLVSCPMTDATLLTSREVAEAFGVTTVTVREWAETGKLPYFRTPGGHRRFRRSDVDAFIAASAS